MHDKTWTGPVPSRQEMFDKAARGLAGQGWKRSVSVEGGCDYLSCEGLRCAWGHVDPDNTSGETGFIGHLARAGIGLAAVLKPGDLDFAGSLQIAHDTASDENLRDAFVEFASTRDLAWPEGA